MASALTPAVLSDLRSKFGATVRSADLWAYNKAVYNEAKDGGLKKVRRGVFSLGEGSGKKAATFDVAAESAKIHERFEVLELLTDGVIAGNVSSMVVCGAPGVGKTYTLETALKAAERSRRIKGMVEIKGSISAIGLFFKLWENREKGQVMVLDDIDSVYGDEEAMNLLKTALDSSKKRVVSWIKDSSFLRDRDIPDSFEYKGQIVFLTNKDLASELERGTKMAPHIQALMSRAVVLDLCIHRPEQVLIRVKHVVKESSMIRELGLRDSHAIEIMDWLDKNVSKMHELSLRTVIKIAGFMKTTPDWQKLARTTMLRGH